MVKNKFKSKVIYLAFLLPALVLYLLFAIVPLFQGMWLSTMKWDGSAPWTPAQIPIADFETKILPKIGEGDKELLTKYYIKDTDQNSYRKLELLGIDRYRVMGILNAAGYENAEFKNVGLQNYVDIFTGKIGDGFFPESYKDLSFQLGGDLSEIKKINKEEFEKNLQTHITDQAKLSWLKSNYQLKGDAYLLDEAKFTKSELDIQTELSQIPALESDWESLFNKSFDLAKSDKSLSEIDALIKESEAFKANKLTEGDIKTVSGLLGLTYDIGKLKSLVSENWYREKTKMGVIVFTVVFVVFNVLLVNVLALLLALALDQKLKSKNLLRAVFYIPNVLSMIIVAFIWQLVFTQLLPNITGVHEWLMNPDIAPWITIWVATWQGVGYYMIIYLAGLQSVPTDMLESASIDGATGFLRFRRIVLPMLAPAITICLFLSIAGALKTFDILFALYPNNSTILGVDNIAVNIFFDAFRDKHAGLATAKALILMIIIMIISGTQLIVSKRKEVEL